MSTTFALFKTIPKLDENLEPIDYEDIDIISCAFRSNSGAVRWRNNFDLISEWIPDDTPVYAINNTPQGIFTISDLKRKINDN
jgi:hypothetical protein